MMEMLHVTKMPTEAKDKLLYAALQLFTTKGFKETSILEVVEQARVSKTTFYRFFRSKEELLVCLFELLANEVLKEVEEAEIEAPAEEETGVKVDAQKYKRESKRDIAERAALEDLKTKLTANGDTYTLEEGQALVEDEVITQKEFETLKKDGFFNNDDDDL